jgi:hypothetical protein
MPSQHVKPNLCIPPCPTNRNDCRTKWSAVQS